MARWPVLLALVLLQVLALVRVGYLMLPYFSAPPLALLQPYLPASAPCRLGAVAALMALPAPPPVDCAALGLQQRAQRAALIDTVMLNNEAEVLLLRLLELDAVVDAFVVVESSSTFTGLPKALVLDEHAACFSRWRGRIHRVVAQPPNGSTAWESEAWLRNQLAQGAGEVIARARQGRGGGAAPWSSDKDILYAVSDVDELPRPLAFAAAAQCTGYLTPIAFQLDRFF